MVLISRRKMSLNTRRLTANDGASAPISPPANIAQNIQSVNERRRHVLTANSKSPAMRRPAAIAALACISAATSPAQ